jgi:hypothetical protein
VVKRRAAPRPLNGIPLSRLTPDQVVARLAMKKGGQRKRGSGSLRADSRHLRKLTLAGVESRIGEIVRQRSAGALRDLIIAGAALAKKKCCKIELPGWRAARRGTPRRSAAG